jgi:hypothetical protein
LEQSGHFLPKSRFLFHWWNNRGVFGLAMALCGIFDGVLGVLGRQTCLSSSLF